MIFIPSELVKQRLYGEVDEVPGFFHVATEFLHVRLVPFVPLRSYLVVQPYGAKFPIGLSTKSVFAFYLQVLSFSGAIIATFIATPTVQEYLDGRGRLMPDLWIPIIFCLARIVSYLLSLLLKRISLSRAFRLARTAGLSVQLLAEYYAKRLSPERVEELARKTCPMAKTSPSTEAVNHFEAHLEALAGCSSLQEEPPS